METHAGKFYLALLGVFICVCLSSCTTQQLPGYDITDRYSNSRQDPRHHSIEKRPTVLLNRLMYALQNAITPGAANEIPAPLRKSQLELQRRGYPKHYWKCYFNAVTCFRRKRSQVFVHDKNL